MSSNIRTVTILNKQDDKSISFSSLDGDFNFSVNPKASIDFDLQKIQLDYMLVDFLLDLHINSYVEVYIDGVILNYDQIRDLKYICVGLISGTVYVAKNGSDATGTGSSTDPYLTIKYALSTITDNDALHRYTIYVGPGVYSEDNPLVCKQYVSIVSMGGSQVTRVNAANVNSDLFTATIVSDIVGFTLAGTTGANLVSMTVANGSFICRDVTFLDALTGVFINQGTNSGVVLYDCVGWTTPFVGSITTLLSSTAGSIVAFDMFVILNANITTLFKADGAAAVISAAGFSSASSNITNGIYVDNSGSIEVTSLKLTNATYGLRIGSSGGDIVADNSWFDSNTYDIYVESASGSVHGSSLYVSRDKLSIATGADIFIFGHDLFGNTFRVLQDVGVGREGIGNRLYVGEGGPYFTHTKIKTFDGASYADIDNGDPINFPNNNINTAIYFGDTDSIPFYAISYIMGATPINLGGGSIVWEYYDGGTASWLACNSLNTVSGKSNSQANVSFIGTNGKAYTIRWDQNIEAGTGVTESDASATGQVAVAVDGETGMWIRCRITSGITTSPVFSTVRMKGSYSAFRTNGTHSLYGEARGIIKLVAEQGVNRGAAANQSLDVSSNINFAFSENKLVNGATDRLFFKILITEEMDTSCGIETTFELCTNISPGGGDQTAKLHFYQSQMSEGDTFDGTALEVEQAFDFVAANGDASFLSQRIIMVNRVNISALMPGDVVYATLERENNEVGDDLTGYVALSNLLYEYRAWQSGSSYE